MKKMNCLCGCLYTCRENRRGRKRLKLVKDLSSVGEEYVETDAATDTTVVEVTYNMEGGTKWFCEFHFCCLTLNLTVSHIQQI